MNKIGILGLGSFSTLHYVQKLNKAYQHRFGGFSTAPFVLLNVDFNTINPYLPNDFNSVIQNLEYPLKELNSLGITHLLVPNITLHESLDKITDELHFQLIHPLPLLSEVLNSRKIQQVVVLGTKYTMNSSYFKSFLESHSIQIMKQNRDFEQQVDDIRRKAYEGIDCINEFKTIVDEIPKAYSIIVACTELSILVDKIENRQIIDLANLQIKGTIELYPH